MAQSLAFGLRRMHPQENALSLYLHIPFCRARCSYCAFNTYTELEHLMPAYVDALCRELDYVAATAPTRRLRTVYFGGGTPSLLPPRHFSQLFEQLQRRFSLDATAEISLEANPDDLELAYLQAVKGLGFNRISIGMQSAAAHILRLFERSHDLHTAQNALKFARQAGFENINLDVIFASPGESFADWRATVSALLDLEPDHISMYGLELKGGTALRQRVDSGALPAPDDDAFADMYEYAASQLSRQNYQQYEISNWCRDGKTCRHNLQYWRNLPYLGLGAGAHGYAGGCRYSTIAAPQRYINALTTPKHGDFPFPLSPAAAKSTEVTRGADIYETIMMGLRLTREGIERERFQSRFGVDFLALFGEPAEKLVALGLLCVNQQRVRLSERGILLSNAVIRELVAALPAAE